MGQWIVLGLSRVKYRRSSKPVVTADMTFFNGRLLSGSWKKIFYQLAAKGNRPNGVRNRRESIRVLNIPETILCFCRTWTYILESLLFASVQKLFVCIERCGSIMLNIARFYEKYEFPYIFASN